MKIKICIMMMLFATSILLFGGTSIEATEKENIERWDITKEYTVAKQDVTYHAYLSKD